MLCPIRPIRAAVVFFNQRRRQWLKNVTTAAAGRRRYTLAMDTCTLSQLPDGTFAAVCRTITWGEALLVLLLVAIVFLKVYELWRHE